MFARLKLDKKIGVICELAGFALLCLTLVLIPLKTAGPGKYWLLPVAALLVLLPIPAMWRDGIRQMKQKPRLYTHWHRMRQSGFFDLLVLLTAIAVVLAACWGFGNITYHATLHKYAPGADTLAQARQLPDFVEYN